MAVAFAPAPAPVLPVGEGGGGALGPPAAEGADDNLKLVLEGMRRTLTARRVAIVQFEVSGRGFWSTGGGGRTAYSRERRSLRHGLCSRLSLCCAGRARLP